MNMKSTLFAGLLAASLSVPAFASDTHTATPLPQFSAADTQMLFAQDTMPMQLAVLSQQEMMETEGAIAFLPFLAWSLGSSAVSAWAYHGLSYRNNGQIGSSSGAAWAAGSGFIGGVHGRGLAAGAGLTGWSSRFTSAHGTGVSFSLNSANPSRR